MIRVFVALVISFASLGLFISDHASASSHPAPEVFANAAHCNRSILVTDDIFCQIRYELPTQTDPDTPPVSPEEWCALLVDTSGCTDTPVRATEETGLAAGQARVSLYDNCGADCLTADLIQTRDVPRVWHGLSGIYIEETSSITWGDTDINFCVESVTGAFTTKEQSCLTPNWSNASNTQTAQRESMGDNMLSNILALQTDRVQPVSSYVSSNRITDTGTVFAKEAFTFAPAILDVFVTTISNANTDQAFVTGQQGQLRTDILATATAITGSYEAFGAVISPTGGPEIGGLILFGSLGVITFFLIYRFTQEFIWPSIGFASWALFGTLAGGVDTQVIFIFVLIMAIPGMVYLFRKIGFAS